MENWLYWVTVAWTVLINDIQSWLKFTFWWNYEQRKYYWWKIGLDIRVLSEEIWKIVQIAYDKAKDWAKDRYDWFRSQIGPIWDSITAIWTRFGADILDTAHSVVSWVYDRLWAVMDWVIARYDEAKTWASDAWAWVSAKGSSVWSWISTKAGSVWEWISTKAGLVWEWISTKAGSVWDWITKFSAWIADLFETGREQLADFLDDPGRFIADWVVDTAEYIVSECVFRFW